MVLCKNNIIILKFMENKLDCKAYKMNYSFKLNSLNVKLFFNAHI